MSWYDGVGRAVSWLGDLTGLSDVVTEVATANGYNPPSDTPRSLGAALDVATKSPFELATGMAGGVLTAPFKMLINTADAYYNNILEPGIDKAVTLQLAMQRPLYDWKDQGQSWGNYIGESFQAANAARDNVSLGQSMASAGIGLANKVNTPIDAVTDPLLRGLPLGPLGVIASVIDSADGDGEKWQAFSPYEKEGAQALLGSSPISKATGTYDFVKELVIDPLNLAAAPVKAVAASRQGAKIITAEAQAAKRLFLRPGSISTEGVMKSLDSGQHQKTLQFIAETDDAAALALWADKAGLGITDPSAFGYLASQVTSTEDAADLFRVLVAPSAEDGAAAAARLSERYGALVGYSVQRAGGRDIVAELAEATGKDILDSPIVDDIARDTLAAADASDIGSKALERARQQTFQQGLDKFTGQGTMAGPNAGMQMDKWLPSARRSKNVGRWAVTHANQVHAQPIVSTYRPHRWHPLVAYVERPSGFVRPENADSYRDVLAQVREIDHVTGGDYVKSGQADRLLGRWWAASTLENPQAERGIIAEMLNEDLIANLGSKHGLDAEDIAELTAKAREKSKMAMDQLRQKGYLSMVLDDGSMGLLRSPVLQRATANAVQLYDARALSRAFSQYDHAGLKALSSTLRNGVFDGTDMVNNLFKVSVLMRLGYTMRNLTEAAWSLAATGNIGHVIMAVGPERFQSWKNGAKLGSKRVIDRVGIRLGALDSPTALEDQLMNIDTMRRMTEKQAEDLVQMVSHVDTAKLAKTDPDLAEQIEFARSRLLYSETTYHGTDAVGFTPVDGIPLSTSPSLQMAQRHAENRAAETMSASDLVGDPSLASRDDLTAAASLIVEELGKRLDAGYTIHQVFRDNRPKRGVGTAADAYGPPTQGRYDYVVRRVTSDQLETWRKDPAALKRAFSAKGAMREFQLVPPGKSPRAVPVVSYGQTLYLDRKLGDVSLAPDYPGFRNDLTKAKAGDPDAVKRLTDAAWEKGYARVVLPDGDAFGGVQVVVNPQAIGDDALQRIVRKAIGSGTAGPVGSLPKVTRKTRRAEYQASKQRRTARRYRDMGNEVPLPIDPAYQANLAQTMINEGLEEVANVLATRRSAISMMRDDIAVRKTVADRRRASHMSLRDRREHFGSRRVETGSKYGEDYSTAGPFASHGGGYWMGAIANDSSYATLGIGSHQALLAGGAHVPTMLDPNNPRYFEGWSNILNWHLRDPESMRIDPVVEMYLQGATYEDILAWATKTKEGYQWVRSIGVVRQQSSSKALTSRAGELRQQLLDDGIGTKGLAALRDTGDIASLGQVSPEVADRATQYLAAVAAADADRAAQAAKTYKGTGKPQEIDVDTVEDAVGGLIHATDLYLPQGPVRDMFMAGEEITPEAMRVMRGDAPDNQPLHSLLIPTSAEAQRNRSLMGWLDHGVNKVMRGLGSIPETSFARHPLFVTVYRDEWVNRIRVAEEQIGQRLTVAQLNRIDLEAKRAAQATVEKTLFTVARRSNFAAKTRWMFPFASAYENVWQRWGSFAKQDPSLPLRMANLVGKFQRGAIIMDQDGNIIKDGSDLNMDAYLVLPGLDKANLPGRWGQAAESLAQRTQIPLASLDLLFQGRPADPGLGPIALLPVAHILRAKPSAEKLLGWTMPYGLPESDLAMFMPTALRRAQSLISKDTTWTNTVTKTMLYEQFRYEQGERDNPPTMDEAIKKANSFYVIRLVTALTAPTAVQWTNERDFYAAKLRELRKNTGSYEQGELEFYRQFPEAGLLVQSLSKNPSKALATTQSVSYLQRYNDDVVKAYAQGDPELAGFIANYGQTGPAQFSQAAYQWERDNSAVPGSTDTYRQTSNPEEAIREAKIAEGWRFYSQVVNQTEALMQGQGIPVDSPMYTDRLAAVRRQAALTINESGNQYWFREFQNPDTAKYARRADFFQGLITNSQFMNDHRDDSLMKSMGLYFAYRDQVRDILESRKQAGGSNSLSAQSNADITADWERKVTMLKYESPEFAAWADRYMRNDPVVG